MPLNETAHAPTWAQESEAHPQFIPPPPGKRIEDIDLEYVWRALGGRPLRGRRGQAFWRDGDGWNISLDRSKGTWYDFATGAGGGIIALVMVVQGCGKAEALAWLADNFGVAVRGPQPASARREYARRMEGARKLAIALAAQRDATIEEIREKERSHLDRYHQLEREAIPAQDMDLAWRAELEMQAADALMALRDDLAAADGPTLEKLFSVGVAA